VPRHSRRTSLRVALLWSATLAAGIGLALRVPFDSRFDRLDGTHKSILRAEADFRRVWGEGQEGRGVLVVSGPTEEQAQRASDMIYAEVSPNVITGKMATLSTIWPSAGTRRQNAERWVRFWESGRAGKLQALLAQEGRRYGFATNAFAAFFAQLRESGAPPDAVFSNQALARLKDQFVHRSGTNWQVVSFFPDTHEFADAIQKAASRHPGALAVSPKALGRELSRTYSAEIIRVTVVAVILIVLVTFLLVRNARITLISLVPPATALVWLLGIMALCGLQLNIANLVAGTVVFGLSLDYGFIIMHSYRHRLISDSKTSVHISALTTIVGTTVLLFARHPALFSMGFTLSIGILSGYAAAMLVVPALYTLLVGNETE
jgi:predicted exporter